MKFLLKILQAHVKEFPTLDNLCDVENSLMEISGYIEKADPQNWQCLKDNCHGNYTLVRWMFRC